MALLVQPKIATAVYGFTATNNDELTFNTGDTITVTQALDGGWWEGTLGDQTGWFPSNYVTEVIKDDNANHSEVHPQLERGSIAYYHSMVLQSLVESEKLLVNELRALMHGNLLPLATAKRIPPNEFSYLIGNLEEIFTLHQRLLSALEDYLKQPIVEQRVGGLFLNMAPSFRVVYSNYCGNHPRAAAVIHRRREELTRWCEERGGALSSLIGSLSRPLTRVQKYPDNLRELLLHTNEAHADRGDTQRAGQLYKDIAARCVERRRQKEVELQLLQSPIRAWEGEPLATLGDVLLMGHVTVSEGGGPGQERVLLLFSNVLIMVSVSPRLSGYQFEGRALVNGLTVKPAEETNKPNCTFYLSGPGVTERFITCSSEVEAQEWGEVLQRQSRQPLQPLLLSLPQQQQQQQQKNDKLQTWSFSCLRPCAPLRPAIVFKSETARKSPKSARRILGSTKRKPDDVRIRNEDGDAIILRVIEAYCTSAKTRHTVNSSILETPSMLIAEDEKIIHEKNQGDLTVVEEKSLVDSVYLLQDQLKCIIQEQANLRAEIQVERNARLRLERTILSAEKATNITAS